MNTASVGVIGGSGYSGIELTRLLALHQQVSVRFVTSDRWVLEKVSDRTGLQGPIGALSYVSPEQGLEASTGLAVVFLCTPAEVSLELAPKLLERKVRVIDLSGAFRLTDPAQYPKAYKLTHPKPGLLAEAVYGLPELCERKAIEKARLVANPGCYATAAALSLGPLLERQVVELEGIAISAASGVTGAGRKATEDFSFAEVADDFRPYRVLTHQHTPEIEQTLGRVAKALPSLSFVPHLLPLKRGIVSTTFATLSPQASAADVAAAFETAYGREPFISLVPSPEAVQLKSVVGTNRCLVGYTVQGKKVVVVTAIDNLVKGAAGQAMQNFNLMCGWAETTGLSSLSVHHP